MIANFQISSRNSSGTSGKRVNISIEDGSAGTMWFGVAGCGAARLRGWEGARKLGLAFLSRLIFQPHISPPLLPLALKIKVYDMARSILQALYLNDYIE